ncbi:cysteine--1-D-myo-inosityl 2-amino-2-deoxy-alpha-D-glucopyranoside ligase [Pseudoclavibacter sp. CFCC 13796]|uniref:cysteine--1-D-myo-inosityl 2-amino-2-deoxy-alpha-D-glucopyranoside ligase n=1 Tax=Pseudoclavibacter sp. CFCC 13796 TaxID=2615179 RepID=UPI00130176D1|nr:cysteine--1-D-myo-inosityl 2-amino-2-deoxy-alpha-D-glucopyranoside ligase [Pseudoclavibacter sp. CFCC 13796]KAB1661767.1 cysteine--1-D-myo-inosityl 2-amino-2-deoxy-alpha-D-glucopyranoside ligase [Pseudoclavibacter sp. CFCC 13796]
MKSWSTPAPPHLPSAAAPRPVRIYDHASDALQPASEDGRTARLYVCGITPYDATHIGHATTYLAYDLLNRALVDSGVAVQYAQNVTDVDDPLLERAEQTGADWEALAAQQIELYRTDMAWLSALAPAHLVGVTEVIDEIGQAVLELIERGFAYRVESPDAEEDIYFDVRAADAALAAWTLGEESRYSLEQMVRFFAERGGDPKRPGKRDRLDPLLWRAERQGEPSWQVIGLPVGRPGWHIECSVIAERCLGPNFDVQGGGSDLIFPHHEMSSGHATAINELPLARIYSHVGMVAYRGRKMSKSLGNLVFVHRLRDAGIEPDAVRAAVFAHHYRSDWEWHDADVAKAQERLAEWRSAYQVAMQGSDHRREADNPVLANLRQALANDLDAPRALSVLDAWADSPEAPELIADAAQALLGIDLTRKADVA